MNAILSVIRIRKILKQADRLQNAFNRAQRLIATIQGDDE